jgi:hypothetical protein
MRADCAIARTPLEAAEGHVLVAGASEEGPAIYLAANGCAVTAVDTTEDVLERVLDAAAEVGLTGRVRGLVANLASWSPDMPLNAVVCAPAAFRGLSPEERERAIAILQAATTAGGFHVLETDGEESQLLRLDELRASYSGWRISTESGVYGKETLLAWKNVA